MKILLKILGGIFLVFIVIFIMILGVLGFKNGLNYMEESYPEVLGYVAIGTLFIGGILFSIVILSGIKELFLIGYDFVGKILKKDLKSDKK